MPALNSEAATLFNRVIRTIEDIQQTGRKVGLAAEEFSAADQRGGRIIGGSGRGDHVMNPVTEILLPDPRREPHVVTLPDNGAVDSLTLAKQFRAGVGPAPARGFAESVRAYGNAVIPAATMGLSRLSGALQQWTPAGKDAAAEVGRHQRALEGIGAELRRLADRIDAYAESFRTAKAKHPTPEEIVAARKELVAALRSKNPIRTQQALAALEDQSARSTDALTGYAAATAPDAKPSSGAAPSSGGGGGQNSDTSALTSMLPSLMSALSSAVEQMQSAAVDDEDYGLDEYTDDYGYGDDVGMAGGAGMPLGTDIPPMDGGGGSGSADPGAQPVPVGAMPTASPVGTASTGTSLPRTPVVEALGASATGSGAARSAGTPMMPYMPMAPGVGGPGGAGGGGDRNRIVAWHPDRLMYVDDTPHTDLVIGERPTIAPTVTPPTPANPAPIPPGGTS
ncbi:hypothetical protein [Nocardia neocaledoniensis]|uniref:hypothetical protein n=1 Tax=Nocardia neocaledoniensis TaxID=236511 RepID=UPI0011B491DA|nr:hypothetical protein [Nocardia neocaledoniensis]